MRTFVATVGIVVALAGGGCSAAALSKSGSNRDRIEALERRVERLEHWARQQPRAQGQGDERALP